MFWEENVMKLNRLKIVTSSSINKLLDFSIEKVHQVKKAVLSIYDKTDLLLQDFSEIMDLLKHDKKNVNGQVNFVLLNDYEDFKIDCKVPEELIVESMEFYNA